MTESGGGAGDGANPSAAPPRPSAALRLLGSLANALLDLGLPTIRQWLRDRAGPAADVAQVTTDGSMVHLDGVHVPMGPRGMLVLERATAVLMMSGAQAATPLGRAGLPGMRLHAFKGVLVFGVGEKPSFRAEVSFTALPDPEEAAWIWGELAIEHVSWSPRDDSPPPHPMHGQGRLFVSSREWRLDGGRIDGETVRARFAASGVFEAAAEELEGGGEDETPIVSRALGAASLALEHAQVGPLLDVVGAFAGRTIRIPTFVPLDAALAGVLSWGRAAGGKVDLRIASEVLGASVRGAVDSKGSALAIGVEADVRAATLLRRIGAPRETLPRDEDVVRVRLAANGELRRPIVNGTITASELGFRLGRPRFVPPVLVRDLGAELFLKHGRAVLRAVAITHGTNVTLDVDGYVREPKSVRGTLRADLIDTALLRDVVRTLDAKLVVADDVSGSLELTLVPGESGPSISGTVIVATPASRLDLAISPGGMHLTGRITAEDTLNAGLFTGAVRPVEGELTVSFDLSRGEGGVAARGTAGTERLALALANRPDVPPYILEAATVNVTIDRFALVYQDLRFRGHGGRFVASGTIPLSRDTDEDQPRIQLRLEEGGAELAEALGHRMRGEARAEGSPPSGPSSAPRQLRVARASVRPHPELWIPADLAASGELRLYDSSRTDSSLVVDVMLETPRGTGMTLALRIGKGGALDGSTLVGTIAVGDVVTSGVLGPVPILLPDGVVSVDAFARGRGDEIIVAGSIAADRLGLLNGVVVTTSTAWWRLDRARAIWKDFQARVHGGSVTSTGVYERSGVLQARASLVSVALHELPPIAGTTPSAFVRGHLSGTVVGRGDVGGSFRAVGRIVLDEAVFPAVELVRPTLAKYGLRPPNEDTTAPVTARIVGSDWGITLRDIELDFRGARVRGEIGLSRARVLDGRADVTLEEDYLRTSKLLTLPRVLTERLVLPVRIKGPLDHPEIHADLGECLGRFLKDNRVRQFVTSAVEEAQILLGRHPISEPTDPPPPAASPELDTALREAVDAHAADWDEIARREAERHGRFRVR